MNKQVKFHPPKSPAFNAGEIWMSSSGAKVEIIGVEPWTVCTGKWDYQVIYWTDLDKTHQCNKNAWSFQVRYEHQADHYARGKK